MSELDVEFPRVAVKRIIKAKLAEHQAQAGTSGQREFQVNKDALTAFSQATKVFITYVTTAANDICRENKRSTVAPQDILQALQELDFPSFMPALEERLQELQSKRKADKEAGAGGAQPDAAAPADAMDTDDT